MVAALSGPLAEQGWQLVPCAWNEPLPDGVHRALIGTAWDYWERAEAFLHTVGELGVPVDNPAAMVRWNAHKAYLRQLAEAGVPSIPTRWLDRADEPAIRRAFDELGTDDLVVKRQVGAGAYQQHRLARGDAVPAMGEPMMAQPFLPSITTEGEVSLVYVDGELSHGVRKRPAAGDYRIQSLYGGSEESHDATDEEQAVARSALAAVAQRFGQAPLYARVDLVRHEGTARLIELELVEPYLYPEQADSLGERLAAALSARARACPSPVRRRP
jgi:glutathione synthase/RimK-type ligase-like ATP-grasp enzyme